MKTTTRKLRPPLKWHGGKTYLARRIIALMPPHRVYVEPFIGGGSILLNKPRAEREVAGDVDARLVLFWRELQRRESDVPGLVATVRYTEEEFRAADALLMADHPAVRSVAFLVQNRFSRGGLGKDFAWSDRLRGGQPGDANAWDTIRAELPAIAERVRGVEFHRSDAIDLIRANDSPDALTYADPPYLHETRTVRDAYRHEMSRDQHAALLECLRGCRGAVMLSGYRSPLYDAALAAWRRVEFDMPNHSGQGRVKQRRVECVWIKPAGELAGRA